MLNTQNLIKNSQIPYMTPFGIVRTPKLRGINPLLPIVVDNYSSQSSAWPHFYTITMI